MPEANQRNIGQTECPFCLSTLTIHSNKNGRYYGHCPECGPFNIHGNSFQDWVEDRLGATIEAAHAPGPEPEPETKADLDPNPEPKAQPGREAEPDEPETQDDDAGRAAFFDMYG